MRFGVDQPSGTRDRYMIRSIFIQSDGQEPPQGKRIGQPPGDTPFAVESLEESNHHHAEVESRRQRRTSQFLVLELGALGLAETIEAGE